jgi:hypothetical protein
MHSGWFTDRASGAEEGGGTWYNSAEHRPLGLGKRLADGALAGAYGGSPAVVVPKLSSATEQLTTDRQPQQLAGCWLIVNLV